MKTLQLELNDGHDVTALKASYARNGFVRIENLFFDSIAQQINHTLEERTPWHMVHANASGAHQYYRPEVWAKVPQDQKMKIMNNVMAQAKDGFSYLYACYPMIQSYLQGLDPQWPLHAMTEFLNTPEFHNFVKIITNEPSVRKIDGQATLYGRGHFLNTHDDTGTSAERRVAYVMGFSKNWSANWGGQLLMLADDDTIQHGFTPSFNTLTLFKVPRRHIVTQVTNFAGQGRYSITGWLRDDI